MSKTSQKARAAATKAAKEQPQVPVQKDATEAFLREVDEAIQQEKLLEFWRTWQVAIVGAVVGTLALVAGWQGWQAWEVHGYQQVAQDWQAGVAAADDAGKIEAERKVLAESDSGYRALAAFSLADREIDPLAADKLYALIYNDGGQEKWVRDLARLNAATRLLGVDDGAAQAHLVLLAQHNAGEAPSPATALALEQLAWLAVRNNDLTTAKGYVAQLLALPGIPADMAQRVGRILSL